MYHIHKNTKLKVTKNECRHLVSAVDIRNFISICLMYLLGLDNELYKDARYIQ